MCTEKFPLVLMGGRGEGLACADLGARTPIDASRNFQLFHYYIVLAGGRLEKSILRLTKPSLSGAGAELGKTGNRYVILRQEIGIIMHMVKTRHVHKAKTTESKQRQQYLYQRTEEYKQVAMCDWAAGLFI